MKRAYSFSPSSNAMDFNDGNEVLVAVGHNDDMYMVSSVAPRLSGTCL
jgi:hypothetical protein